MTHAPSACGAIAAAGAHVRVTPCPPRITPAGRFYSNDCPGFLGNGAIMVRCSLMQEDEKGTEISVQRYRKSSQDGRSRKKKKDKKVPAALKTCRQFLIDSLQRTLYGA